MNRRKVKRVPMWIGEMLKGYRCKSEKGLKGTDVNRRKVKRVTLWIGERLKGYRCELEMPLFEWRDIYITSTLIHVSINELNVLKAQCIIKKNWYTTYKCKYESIQKQIQGNKCTCQCTGCPEKHGLFVSRSIISQSSIPV